MRKRGRPVHPDLLTPAEWRVVDGVRHGLSNPAMARRLGVGIDAVKFHVSNALQKLGLRDRRQLRLWRGVRGALAQIARGVSDILAAERWYRDVLGLPHLFTFGTLAFFDCGGVRLMLSQTPSSGESLLYFRVERLHEHYDAVLARGAKPLGAPHRVHRHADGREEWLAFIEDNEGRPLGLAETLPPAE
jgi:DNA-binding CsgD family transcriptional regulator/catechol 2,3-dioxygenase-like lactoylglutathione lyase family enzyme